MTDIKAHTFNLKLPMHPNLKIGDAGMPCELEMDGKPLRGVSSLVVRAGSNGFTNVVMEFEASCALELAGALIANIQLSENARDRLLGGVFDIAMDESGYKMEDMIDLDGAEKADFVKSIIEQTIVNLHGE